MEQACTYDLVRPAMGSIDGHDSSGLSGVPADGQPPVRQARVTEAAKELLATCNRRASRLS